MRLAQRERYFVIGGSCFLALLLAWQFALVPLAEKRARLTRGIAVKQQELAELKELASRYMELRQDARIFDQLRHQRHKGFSLFTFLEKEAAAGQVKEYITYMKPSQVTGPGGADTSLVEMRLEGIPLGLLVRYLERIETPESLVIINRISLQENKKKTGHLDATLQVLTYS